jgi:hypothetical protein
MHISRIPNKSKEKNEKNSAFFGPPPVREAIEIGGITILYSALLALNIIKKLHLFQLVSVADYLALQWPQINNRTKFIENVEKSINVLIPVNHGT